MQITERANGYDIALADYDRELSEKIKRLPGDVFWNGSFYKVNYPASPGMAVKLERAVERLQRWYQKRQEEAILNAPKILGEIPELPALTLELPVRRPLYPYQAPGVQYCLDHAAGTIIGDQPGLGKTTIAAATLLAGRVSDKRMVPALIVCPTTLKRKWQKELRDVTGYNALILTDKYKNSWPRYIQTGMIDAVIVNFESLKKYFVQAITNAPGEAFRLKDVVFRPEIKLFKTLIVDEIHRAKDVKAQQSKFIKGIADQVENRYGLTGTMFVNEPDDIISQLAIIGRLREFGGLTRFKIRYCKQKERAGGVKYYPNLDELNYLLSTRCYFRREKKDVLKDLPDKTRKIISVDITTRQEYDTAEKSLEAWLRTYKNENDENIRRKLRAKMLVQMGVLGEISARGKIQAIKEWGENLVQSGEKIVMFCDRQGIIEDVKQLFNHCLEVTGSITGDRRDRAVELFQTSPRHMAIALNIKAGGVGIDLFASSNVGFIMLPWHHADLEQCEDRCHRNGQKNAVVSALFIGRDTVDEYRWTTIQEKKELAKVVHGAQDEISEEQLDGLMEFFNKRSQAASAGQLFAA